MNITRTVGVLALLGALQLPAYAQLPEPRPEIFPIAGVGPDESEWLPAPERVVPVLFGSQITGQKQTTLFREAGYPDGERDGPARVAVFIRDASGKWVRSGSIDPPAGVTQFAARMALFNELSLFQASQGRTALLYRRSLGKWKLVQKLTPPSGYQFTDVRLSSGWAFIGAVSAANAGAVYVYQVTSAGTLKGVQTLGSNSGNSADGFGAHVAVFGERVVVSAGGDSNNRGAAYVFERSGALFARKQKLIAMNGAPNQHFANFVGISEDWIAIGAPDVEAPPSECGPDPFSGAIYTFRRIGGVWLQQEELLAQDAQDQAHTCIGSLGEDFVISGKWLVATIIIAREPFQVDEPLIYVRDAGHYAPTAWAAGTAAPDPAVHLVDNTLFVGEPDTHDCQVFRCIGDAAIFDLNEAVP